MEPALLILAAGMGSRYGGMKQVDAVGPSGETIMDYSIFDAQRSGINKIVFVIRKDYEREFKNTIINRYKGRAGIYYVIQDLTDIPEGITVNAARTKPWGTCQAVIAGEEIIKDSFIVINADDFYGFNSFRILTDYLKSLPSDKKNEYGLAGFVLKNTLSEHGSVSRGVCEADDETFLKTITERTKIKRENNNIVYYEGDKKFEIDGNSIVSMNMWGFTSSIFPKLKVLFKEFLDENGQSLERELFLPSCVDELIKAKFARVKLLKSDSEWFGLTYKEDKPAVVNRIKRMIAEGAYPQNLFH